MNTLLRLNLRPIKSPRALHALPKAAFGFPDFYGANCAALEDCLSSLRFAQDGMSTLRSAMQDVNARAQARGQRPSLALAPLP